MAPKLHRIPPNHHAITTARDSAVHYDPNGSPELATITAAARTDPPGVRLVDWFVVAFPRRSTAYRTIVGQLYAERPIDAGVHRNRADDRLAIASTESVSCAAPHRADLA